MENRKLAFTLSLQEANVILGALAQQKLGDVVETFFSFKQQADQQVARMKEEPPKAPDAN